MTGAPEVSPYVAAAARRASIQHTVTCGQCGRTVSAVATADELHGDCPRHGPIRDSRAHVKVAAFEALAKSEPTEREHWEREAAHWRERAEKERAAEAPVPQAAE